MGWSEDIEVKKARIAAIRQKRNQSQSAASDRKELPGAAIAATVHRARSPLSPASLSPSPVDEVLGYARDSRSTSRTASLVTPPPRDELISSILSEVSRSTTPPESSTYQYQFQPQRSPSQLTTSASRQASLSSPSPPSLSVTSIFSLNKENDPPQKKSVVMYSKQIQTELDSLPVSEPPPDLEILDIHTSEPLVTLPDQSSDETVVDGQPSIPTIKDLVDEKAAVDPQLSYFLFHSFNFLKRAALHQAQPNITIDYGSSSSGDMSLHGEVTQIAKFSLSSTISAGRRTVTSIDWSPRHPELLAVSYSKPVDAIRESKGLVVIWNLYTGNLKPEYVFYASSEILCIKFSTATSNLLFGSAYNGQVLLWDMNLYASNIFKGRYPVSGSNFIGKSSRGTPFRGHSSPLYSMVFAGSHTTTSQLYTASTDGKVCCWMPEQLSKPQDILELQKPVKSSLYSNLAVVPTSMTVSATDASLFFVGTENGNVYQCNRTGDATRNPGIDPRGYYDGHTALVTSVDLQKSKGNIDLSQVLLTASLDWSIKLWKIKKFSDTSIITTNDYDDFQSRIEPIFDIQCDYPVYDAAWSPICPELFASVDGSGRLSVWNVLNLMKKSETPVLSIAPQSVATQQELVDGDQFKFADPLTKLRWDIDGKRIAVGSSFGEVTVFAFDKEIYSPQNQDYKALKILIDESD